MKNRTLVTILLIVAAVLSLFGVMLEYSKKYEADMNVAVTSYITQDGPEAKMVKITVFDEETAVATYDIYEHRCETHVVKALTAPTEGLYGTRCVALDKLNQSMDRNVFKLFGAILMHNTKNDPIICNSGIYKIVTNINTIR